jgi:hypothetical protein
MSEFKYEIIKELGVISERKGGWSKQLNLISWNDAEPKYDIRDWAPEREKMGKGVSLSAAELQTLTDILNDLEL